MTKIPLPTRHIISINDLTNKEIETIFEVAQGFLKELADEKVSYRIGRSTDLASQFILASLFYEPSTRTRLSFESAMLRLGGANITSADPTVSSAAKGESLADTIRVISNYADIVVIRHPRDGAARLAAEYSQIPVINGGDGSHEHPTQTLCDLFTLKSKKKTLKNMKVAISGDLKGSRTIHSFVYALARFGATIDPLPAPGMELPPHVDRRLREEFHCRMVSKTRDNCLVARSTRSTSPRINRTSYRSFRIPKSITGCWCRRKPMRSMLPASKRSAGPRRSGRIRRSTQNSWMRRNIRMRASCIRCRA